MENIQGDIENIQKTFEILNNNILEINNGKCNTLKSNTLKKLIEGFDEVVKYPNLRPTWTACLRNVNPLSGQQHAKIQKVIDTIIEAEFTQNSKASLMGVLKEELGVDVDKSRGDDNTPIIIHLPKPPEPEHATTKASFTTTAATAAEPARSAKPTAQLKLQENTFATVTRMMSREQLQTVIEESARRETQIKQLTDDLNQEKGNWQEIWKEIISRYKEQGPDFLAKDGLIAFKNGSITMEQFCTLTTCWSLMKDFPNSGIQVYPLFDADENPIAKDAFKSSIYTDGAEVNFFTREEAERVTHAFFENMKTKSSSEKVFFSTYGVPVHGLRDQDPESLGGTLKNYGFRACNFFVDRYEKRMVPSFSMVQACVDACGQNNTIAPSPVIGYSTTKDIYNNIKNHGRDVLLPFPGIIYDDEYIQPATADSLIAESYIDFYLHDLYHCVLVSYVPDGCRQEAARLALEVVKKKQNEINDEQFNENPIPYYFLNELYDKLVDMEFTVFRPDSQQSFARFNLTDGELFLCQLHHTVNSALKSLRKKLMSSYKVREKLQFKDQEKFQNFLTDSPIFLEIVEFYRDKGFCKNYLCRPIMLERLLIHERFHEQALNPVPENASILGQSVKRLPRSSTI